MVIKTMLGTSTVHTDSESLSPLFICTQQQISGHDVEQKYLCLACVCPPFA